MATKHIPNADGKGWLKVLWEDGSEFPPLPQKLTVNFERTEDARDHFVVSEGLKSGSRASVRRRADGTSYLLDGDATSSAATVRFKKSTSQLWFGGVGPIAAITLASASAPLGTHDLELPYEVHDLAAGYEGQSVFAKTWFRIGHSGDRFLHPGAQTAGCVTVTAIDRWTEVYNYLIAARKGDGQSVGSIEIID